MNPVPYPIPDVIIEAREEIPLMEHAVYSDAGMQVNAHACRLEIPGAGVYYAREGQFLWFMAGEGVNRRWAEAQLQRLPLAALLHQRGILHFHAASFVFEGAGVLLLGQSGAGKSSLAAAFHLSGAKALSDDLSAVTFDGDKPLIWPMDHKIRLHREALARLGLNENRVEPPDRFTGKFALKTNHHGHRHPLHFLFHLEPYPGTEISIKLPPPEEQFSLLRSEICHWKMLRGMPETEKKYLHQILVILSNIPLIRIFRPESCKPASLRQSLENYIRESGKKP